MTRRGKTLNCVCVCLCARPCVTKGKSNYDVAFGQRGKKKQWIDKTVRATRR